MNHPLHPSNIHKSSEIDQPEHLTLCPFLRLRNDRAAYSPILKSISNNLPIYPLTKHILSIYLPYLPVIDAELMTLPSIAFLKTEREVFTPRSSFSTVRA